LAAHFRPLLCPGPWKTKEAGGMALQETRGPSTHLHCCLLEAVPKERAGGLQIFLRVRKCYYLLQLNWKRKKKKRKKNPYRRIEGRYRRAKNVYFIH